MSSESGVLCLARGVSLSGLGPVSSVGVVHCLSWTARESFVSVDSYDIVVDVTLLGCTDVPWAFEVSELSESSMPANVGK